MASVVDRRMIDFGKAIGRIYPQTRGCFLLWNNRCAPSGIATTYQGRCGPNHFRAAKRLSCRQHGVRNHGNEMFGL